MFGASSELASVMEFGLKQLYWMTLRSLRQPLAQEIGPNSTQTVD